MEQAHSARTAGRPDWFPFAAVLLAIVVALVVWLVFVKANDDDGNAPAPPPAVAASVERLRALPGEAGHAIYWAGRRHGYTYELTQVNGNTFIRYLPAGVAVNDARPDYLTIGTYPKARSYALLRRQGRQPGGHTQRAGDALVVWSDNRPQSVYIAYRGADLQIEVYDPSPTRAREIATSGAVKPIR